MNLHPEKTIEQEGTMGLCPFTNDLEYLQSELDWIEARALRISAEHRLRRLEADDERTTFNRHRIDSESPRQLFARSQRSAEREQQLRGTIDQRLAQHRHSDAAPLAIDVLCESFGLDTFHRTVLLLAVAPCFSQRFERVYGQITGHDLHDALTVEVAFTFAELNFAERIERRIDFSRRGPLIQQDLIVVDLIARYNAAKDLLGADLEINHRTLSYLLGRDELADEFLEFSSVEAPCADLEDVVLDDSARELILSIVDRHDDYLERRAAWGFDQTIRYGRGSLMLFYGPPGTGKTMTAHGIAQRLGKRIMNVDIPTFVAHSDAERYLPGLFREARLQNAVLFFDECESLFGSRRSGNTLMTLLLTELERFEGFAIFATNLPEQLDEAFARRVMIRISFDAPDADARAAIWRQLLPLDAPLADDVDLRDLGARYEMSGGFIKNAVLSAVAASVHDGDEAHLTMAHLSSAAKEQCRPVNTAGEPVEVPSCRLNDLVISPTQLDSVKLLLTAVRHRPTLISRWRLGGPRKHSGIAALFHGPPGTGKTLCAEALAGELNRPLKRVRTSSLLSKWIGQSERNLEAIFVDARAENAVILIDEADGLLGARCQQDNRHDRNLVNLLLDLVERYPGLVILATNHLDALDVALRRRLSFTIHFAHPTVRERTDLWQRMLPASNHLKADVNVEKLAESYTLSGAEIHHVIMTAATVAAAHHRPIAHIDLVQAAVELQSPRDSKPPIGFEETRHHG